MIQILLKTPNESADEWNSNNSCVEKNSQHFYDNEVKASHYLCGIQKMNH